MYIWVCSVMSDSLQPHGLQPARLLCPLDGPRGGLPCPSPVIFPTQGSNLCLLQTGRQILYLLSHGGGPTFPLFLDFLPLKPLKWLHEAHLGYRGNQFPLRRVSWSQTLTTSTQCPQNNIPTEQCQDWCLRDHRGYNPVMLTCKTDHHRGLGGRSRETCTHTWAWEEADYQVRFLEEMLIKTESQGPPWQSCG